MMIYTDVFYPPLNYVSERERAKKKKRGETLTRVCVFACVRPRTRFLQMFPLTFDPRSQVGEGRGQALTNEMAQFFFWLGPRTFHNNLLSSFSSVIPHPFPPSFAVSPLPAASPPPLPPPIPDQKVLAAAHQQMRSGYTGGRREVRRAGLARRRGGVVVALLLGYDDSSRAR